MIDNTKNLISSCAIAFVLGALSSGAGIWKYEENRWGKVVEAQKKEASEALATETEKVLKAERAVTELNNQLEIVHAEAAKTIDATLADNRRLARELGGLRDPGRRPSCGVAQAASGSSTDTADKAAESRLSDEATEFLLEFAAEADRAAEYARTCHNWAVEQAQLK